MAKPPGEEPNGVSLCALIEPPQDGINEGRDGEFHANKYSDTYDGGDLEREHGHFLLLFGCKR
jgi:hypothetical protein